MNENSNSNITFEESEFDLRGLLFCYLRRWWLILLCGAIAASCTFVFVKQFIEPKYRASVSMYVNNMRRDAEVDYITSSNISASQQLVNTYINIVRSDSVLERVVEEADLDVSASTLKSMVSASQVDETEMFRIYVTSTSPRVAAALANAVAEVSVDAVAEIIDGSSVKIIDRAKVPTSIYSPNYMRYTILGGTVGCVGVLVVLTILFLLDVKVKDAEDLERMFGLPVLGQIPVFSAGGISGKYGYGKGGYGKYGYGYGKYGYGYGKHGYGYGYGYGHAGNSAKNVKTKNNGKEDSDK